jgi:plasmid maintenance system antidote protein VapI
MAKRKKPVTLSASLRYALRHEVITNRRTAYELAEAAGVDRSVLSRFMSEKRTITLETADRLAGMLGLSLSR